MLKHIGIIDLEICDRSAGPVAAFTAVALGPLTRPSRCARPRNCRNLTYPQILRLHYIVFFRKNT